MVVCTMTKKQIMRTAGIVLIAAAAIAIAVFAVLGSVTASADSRKLPVYSVDREDNRIALTFDCAWGNSNTDELLEILDSANAKATFFVTGEFCDKYPDDVKKLAAAGHSIQNHSDKHPHVKGMNINDLIADTKECERKITMLTGKKPVYYRAPYGEYDDSLITTIEGMGYQVVQWSADSIDWEDPDVPTIKRRIMNGAQSGAIMLFHNDLSNTTQALPSILTELRQKGFEPVTLENMIYTDNYTVDSTGKQIYTPVREAVVALEYSDNPYLESGFEKIRENLSIQQIYDLSSVAKVDMIDTIKSFLTEEEINAFREASYTELRAGYNALVYTAERYGAGGAYTVPAQDENDKTYEAYGADGSAGDNSDNPDNMQGEIPEIARIVPPTTEQDSTAGIKDKSDEYDEPAVK